MNLSTFDFNETPVRVVDVEGEPWFVAADVCRVLDLGNPTEAVRALEDDEKITLSNSEGNPRAGIPHSLNAISESGLYSLVFRSRKEEAKTFRRWVTKEVLPAIRKTGRYEVEVAAEVSPIAAAVASLLGNVSAAERAREGVLEGTLSLEAAQVVSSLCSEVRASLQLRLKIAPVVSEEPALGGELGAALCEAAGRLAGDGCLSLRELLPEAARADGGKSAGRRLQVWMGQHLRDGLGRAFVVRHKRTRDGVRYVFAFDGQSQIADSQGGTPV